MNFKSPYKLAIVAIVLYSTSMLVYGSIRIFIGEKIEAISAFGSVLSAIGAFFAAFVALHIFNGWKDQASFALKKEHVNYLSGVLSKGFDETHKISEIIINLAKISNHEVLSLKYSTFKANDLRSEFYDNQINAKMLDRLNTKEKDIFIYYSKYQTHFIYLVENFNYIQNYYIKYFNDHVNSMSNAEKILFERNGSLDFYANIKPKTIEKQTLEILVSREIKFYGNNNKYRYKNIEEMIKKMDEIYYILENKVLDSINLKIT